MDKFVPRLLLAVLSLAGFSLAYFFYQESYLFLSFLLVIGVLATAYIFLRPSAYPQRFMYPGIFCFVFFMVFPMLLTIYIGFTNLKTGHFLSQQKVFQILKDELIINEDVTPYFFKIVRIGNEQNRYQVIVQTQKENPLQNSFAGEFAFNEQTETITLTPHSDPVTSYLSGMGRKDIFLHRHILRQKSFILPSTGEQLKYYRTQYLAPLENRYQVINSSTLQDKQSGEVFTADQERGYFTNGKWDLAPGFYVITGAKNFISLFTDHRIKGPFVKVLSWTLAWALISVLLAFGLGIFLAILVNDGNLRFRPLYRVLLIIPYSIPFFISVLIFRGLFNKDFGMINNLLEMIKISPVPWLDDPLWAKISVLLVNLWLGFPYMFLVTTGILQSIPQSVYEAASIDGAGRWAKFRHITLPMVMSAVAPLLVGSFAFNLNNFVGIYLLTGGLPPMKGAMTPVGETDILISYTFRLAFEGGDGQDFGLASSISVFIFLIIAAITLLNFKYSGMMKEEELR